MTPDDAAALGYGFAGLAAVAFAAVMAWLAWETGRDDRLEPPEDEQP